MKKVRVIAIDGPAASGKSTAAKNVAKALSAVYINTGSIYRAIAWKAKRENVAYKDEPALCKMLENTSIVYGKSPSGTLDVAIDGVFPGPQLRLAETAKGASDVSSVPGVRRAMIDIQRKAAEGHLTVMEGRDIGTVIFPDAKYKFFLTASPLVRAKRRFAQADEIPDGATIESIAKDIEERDRQDATRAVAPLKQSEDAVLIDSSDLNQEQVLEKILSFIDPEDKQERD